MPEQRTSCAQPTPLPPLAPKPALLEGVVRKGDVRASRMGRRRAWVLLLVHVLIFAHILHWKLAGKTLSPLEPSEAIYSIASGVINAGAILLLVSIFSTLLLGRWFCGWACHLVALQDGAAWILKKLHIRPKPIRSRWLMTIPLLAGLYMFGWPAFHRFINRDVLGKPDLGLELHVTDFWATFPGFGVALLTFLSCGFLMIYLLGSKGFCMYACPYGGLFGVVEKLAPARIRVTDACRGCGHCTAVCTSNVLVHQEVRDYGMVIDSACMKCLDCVSVCPENALYFGFGKPAILAGPRVKKPKRRGFGFTWREDVAMGIVFLVTLLIYRGLPDTEATRKSFATPLYSLFPLLFSLGLSAMTAFMALLAVRTLRREELGWQWLTLKKDRRLTRSGLVFLTLFGIHAAFLVHSAVYQGFRWTAEHEFRQTDVLGNTEDGTPQFIDPAVVWSQPPDLFSRLPEANQDAIRASEAHFATAWSLGLRSDPLIPRRRAWLALLEGKKKEALTFLETARAVAPDFAANHGDLGRLYGMLGRTDDAFSSLREAVRLAPESLDHHLVLVRSLIQVRDNDAAVAAIDACLATHPPSATLYALRAAAHAQAERGAAAIMDFDRALALTPNDPNLLYEKGRALFAVSRHDESIAALRQALDLDPASFAFRMTLAEALMTANRTDAALEVLDKIPAELSEHPNVLDLRGRVLIALGRKPEGEALIKRARERAGQ